MGITAFRIAVLASHAITSGLWPLPSFGWFDGAKHWLHRWQYPMNYEISVVIPLFNREDVLHETLESMLAQTFANWRGFLVDDGSTDGTIDVAETFAKRDFRFSVHRRESSRKGASVCRNEGLARADSDYIVFLDSDDCLAPTALESRLLVFKESPELDFLVFQAELFDARPGDLDLRWNIDKDVEPLLRFLANDVPWPVSGPIWKTKSLKRIGGFREELPSFQDWELHVRAIYKGLRYRYTDVVDHFVRIGHSNRETIGRHCSVDIFHLMSRKSMLDKVHCDLDELGLLDSRFQTVIASHYLSLCQQMRQHDRRLSLETWHEIKQRCSLSYPSWAMGRTALELGTTPVLPFLLSCCFRALNGDATLNNTLGHNRIRRGLARFRR